MKLIKVDKTEINQDKDVPGLLSCRIAYEIKTAKGSLNYYGPKFSADMWNQVLSFFRWTFKEMESESQVRLYVNTKLEKWGAWAFPQEARSGMSAREIVVQETPEQALQRFASWNSDPSGDWVYFCTVHHHCSAGAFQSGTDEKNEKNQDGLHITIGKMDADRHDLHARFYLNGSCFDPDLSQFWELGLALEQMVPRELLDDVARHQMCEKITVDFPDVWRANVVEIKRQSGLKTEDFGFPDWGSPRNKIEVSGWVRVERTLKEITRQCEVASISEPDCVAVLQALCEDPVSSIIIKACVDHEVTPEDVMEELQHYQINY